MYSDMLYRYALKISGNEMDADDIVQVVFEKVWKRIDKVDFDRVKSLLFKIAHNHVIDQYRKTKSRREHEQQYDVAHTESYKQFEASDILEQAFEKLSEEYKSLIMMRDAEGYAYEEIAEALNLSLSQVKVYLFRARKQMQEAIKSLEYYH